MKYKKFKPTAIMPLWARIIFWIAGIPAVIAIIIGGWIAVTFIVTQSHKELLFISRRTFDMGDALGLFVVLGIFVFILSPLFPFLSRYITKFNLRTFKLSDIRNPEKYDPNVIRQYFPEYLSKKEKEERAANTDEKAKEDLQKATEIINKYTKELGEDKVISIIKGV
jgi:hypothetical protein